MENWKQLREFPDYSISNKGRVRKDDYDRIMSLTLNQKGILMAGLTLQGVQYRRSVVVMVAHNFLTPHPHGNFDTPIQLDGDRTNAEAENLQYRPMWFARRYHLQFNQELLGSDVPVKNLTTGETYPTSWEAAIHYGLLVSEILNSINNRTYVWPTYHTYDRLN